ncbi:MAG: hypothetical protein ACRDHU_04465 [Actinomycetota bacterium]
MRPVELLGFAWTLPNTLLGLVLGALTFRTPRIHGGAIVFDRGSRGVTALLQGMHRTAMTVGFVILGAVPIEGRLLVHERHHVRQYMAWGPLFIPVYLLLGIPYGYRRHPMERAARRAAGEEGPVQPA